MPGTSSITVSNEQLSTQMFRHLSDYRRLQQANYPVTDDWLAAAEVWDGGSTEIIPFEVDDHSSPTELVHGYEAYNQAISTTMIFGTMTPAWVVQPILTSEIEEKINSGRGKVIDRVKKNSAGVNDNFRRNIQKVFLRGPTSSGSYVAPKGFTSWNTINGEDFATGFLELTTPGSNTLHGISKTGRLPATHPRLHNLFFDLGSAAGTNALNMMYQACVDMSLRAEWPTPKDYKWYISGALAGFLKRAFRSFEQYVANGNLDDGARRPIGPGGVPMVPVADLAQDGLNTAADKFSAIMLNWRTIKPVLFAGWKLDATKFVEIPGTVGVRASIMKLGGNVRCQEPGLNAAFKNGEAY